MSEVLRIGVKAISSLKAFQFILTVNVSRDMKLPTMWYVQPAKTQISLRIHTV